ncbi:MAG: VOC family protein [Rhodanobacteraceae bacterium]|nr:VOC family protein [Rhodanobacteraceae bacterium]
MKIEPYLMFDGNCAEAFAYYTQHLGGNVVFSMKYSQAPESENLPPEMGDKIMHASIVIDGHTLMGSDAMSEQCPYEKPRGISLALSPSSLAEAERIFAALSDGGEVQMPLAQTFWALRFGTCTDRFGIPWMVNLEQES